MRRWLLAVFCLAATTALARDREHGYDLIHVDWSLSFNESRAAIFGDVTNTLVLTKPSSTVELDCGKLTVRRAMVNGQPASFALSGETLTVELGRETSAGTKLDVRVVYHGVPEAGVYFVPAERAYPAKTGMIYTQGEAEDTRYWLPTYDFPNDKATTSAHITVEPGLYALGNGELERIEKTNAAWTYHWRMQQPHATYLIAFIVGDYETGHEKWDGLDVFWAVPKGLGSMGRAAFDGTADMVRFFSELTGVRYPYAKFSQAVVSDYMFGGMENITMVTNTIGAIYEENESPPASAEGLVLHELAHQWFGDTVTCRDWSHIWINEGWASFLPHFYVREKHGEDQYHLSRYGLMQGAIASAQGSKRPMVSDDYEIPMDMFDGNAYAGGAARMFLLMELLGEETFWRCTKAYLERFKFKSATTEDFFQVFKDESRRGDLDRFLKDWFYTPGVPEVTVAVGDQQITITQSEPARLVHLKIGVLRDGVWSAYTISVSTPSRSFPRVGNREGDVLVVDPDCAELAVFKSEPPLTKEQVAMAIEFAPNAALKARMSQRMRGWTSAEKQAVYDKENSVPVKAMLLQVFGSGDEAFLVRESKSAEAQIAVAAISQLPACQKTDAVVARLREIADSHPNPRMRATALRALIEHTKDTALVERAWRTDSTDQAFRLMALDFWVRNDPDRARTLCIEQLRNPTNEYVRTAAIRYLGGLKDKPGSRDAFNALMGVLRENSFGARSSAINSLVQYGDREALVAIEPLRNHSLWMIRRTAEGAYAALSKD
ncbi:MAG: M1 family metallopeptidase [Fimbriimonadaceae bacterium]